MTEDHIRESRVERAVKHVFTDEEKQKFTVQLADAYSDIESAESEFDVLKKQHKTRVSEKEATIAACVEKIRSGYEMRRETCRQIKDYQANTITIMRDNGEVLEERTMTAEEINEDRQRGLFEESPESGEEETEEGQEGEEETADEEEGQPLEAKHTFTADEAYDVVVQGPKRRGTRKDLVYKETKTDGDNSRVGHIFKDSTGRTQLIDDDTIVSFEPAGNAG